MPGEVQGCVGCHADRNYALQRAGAAELGTLARHASEPQPLREPDWGVKGFSYLEVVQPVLDRYCVECHNARTAPQGVDLSGDKTDFFNVSYDILARKGTLGELQPQVHGVRLDSRDEGRSPYTSWISTINGADYNILLVQPKTWGSPASKLADLLLAGHPDAEGKPRLHMDPAQRRRILAWIDLNVPYYPTSAPDYPDRMGCRRLMPVELNGVLQRVAQARCAACHRSGLPRQFYTRITNPQLNNFLLAPLAKAAGGTEVCGRAVFASSEDPDYQAILKTFEPITNTLRATPRSDVVNGPAACPLERAAAAPKHRE
jgi:mono/diheme cytochrome c family protein